MLPRLGTFSLYWEGGREGGGGGGDHIVCNKGHWRYLDNRGHGVNSNERDKNGASLLHGERQREKHEGVKGLGFLRENI